MRTKFLACVVNIGLALHGLPVHAQGPGAARPALASRVAPPAPDVIAHFARAGMRDIRPHEPTAAERQRIDDALAALPALHRLVLEKRLRRLSFVDGIPGSGSGLFSTVEGTGQFDITLRASLLHESLGEFLTTKERRLFAPDGSGLVVTVEATGADALTYVLLHEASHAVDRTLRPTAGQDSPFTRGIWEDPRTLAPALASSAAAGTPFRGAPPIPMGRARAVYEALARTPFASLYATAAVSEDFAELVAWHHLSTARGGALTISLHDGNGVEVSRHAPLDNPAFRARTADVDALLRRAHDGRDELLRLLEQPGG